MYIYKYIRIVASICNTVTDFSFSSAQLAARASAANGVSIRNKVSFRLRMDSFIVWFNEKVRLRKLRAGLRCVIQGSGVRDER